MSALPRLTVLFGVASSLAANAGDAKLVRIDAVVQKYEIAAGEDIFDDGRFVTYDAVTFKVVAPMTMADKTIRILLASRSVADDSRWQKPGERCRFDFDKDLLKRDQLFRGALENFEWINSISGAAIKKKMRPVDSDVLVGIEKQLAQLHKNAEAETGPELSGPSSLAAYRLIADFAKQGEPIEQLSEAERRVFDVQPRGSVRAKVVAVFADVRVALIDYAIRDKAGLLRISAIIYVQQDGKWLKKGEGAFLVAAHPEP
jgi:hypothetical protein